MLARISWSDARKTFLGTKKQPVYYTQKDGMRTALRSFGVITSKSLVRCTVSRQRSSDKTA
jgi:hypothetical protein